MTSLKTLVLAVGLVAATGCHRSDSASDKLRDERIALGDRKVDEIKQTRKVVETSNELARAAADFRAERRIRYQGLSAELQVIHTQPQLINAIAQNIPLTDESRAEITDKLSALQVRYDEARNQVERLRTSNADHFQDEDARAKDAMDKLHDATKDAWDAVKDAHRTDRTS